MDFGNEIEMRSVYKRQRRWLIPTLTAWAFLFGSMAVVLSKPRWAGGRPREDMDVFCGMLSAMFAVMAIWQARVPFEEWIKSMPQQPRIAGD